MKTTLQTLWRSVAAMAAAMLFALSGVSADQHGSSQVSETAPMTFIEWSVIDPAVEADYIAAWKTVREIAVKEGYPFPTQMAQFRNQYYWFTPIEEYGDLDMLFQIRGQIYDTAGEQFQTAVAKLNECTTNRQTWVSHYNGDLSYLPAGAVVGDDWNHMEVNIFQVKYGHGDKAKAILKEMKTVYSDLQIPDRYNVYEGGIGAQSNSLVMVNYSRNALDAAAAREARNAQLQQSAKWQELYDRFLTHVQETEYLYASPRRDLALVPTTSFAEMKQR